jgi:DNA-binding response OmpR family regulator
LAILDINMPELDGREVYGRIRLKWKQCAILFLSGSAEEFPSVSPDEAGMVECLTKPFGNKDLLEVVRRLLDRRSGKV